MKLYCRRTVLVVCGLMLSAGSMFGETCAQLKAEIANLQQTLANERRALASCNDHPGTCTPGQIAGFQQAIQTAQDEIMADDAELPTACQQPPLPNFDHVALQAVEVTQAIQDTGNSVTLIAGKSTWVRVYLGKNNGMRRVTGILQTRRGSTTLNVNALAPIMVDANEDLATRRKNWSKSLNFAVPAAMISSGTTTFAVGTLTDMSCQTRTMRCTNYSPKTIICDDCTTPTQVDFFNMPPLIVRAIGLTYQFTPSAGLPLQTASPRALDYALLQSWLRRAYPVSQVSFSQTTVASTNAWPFNCTQANAQLAAIRAVDVAGGIDNRTHYIGLVSNQGGFMKGCSSGIPAAADPATTAAGPSGPTSGGNAPVNVTGDNDGSFADWYGGHELAHTFGRAHPGFCNGNSRDDTAFPYPNGQLSDGTENSFVGLDIGDNTNTIVLAVLWGGSNFDIMTYCNQPQWLSAYTYAGVRQRLLDENPGFRVEAFHPHEQPTTPLVHVVATVNLTKHTGSIDYVDPIATATPSTAPTGRAELVVRDANGRELYRQPVFIRLMTDVPPGEDQTAIIDALLPFREEMGQIDLVLDGTVLAQYKNAREIPPPVTNLRLTPDPESGGMRLSWVAPAVSAGKLTFTVQGTNDGEHWETIAVGLRDPNVKLSLIQAQARTLRVITSNGFRRSAPVTISGRSPVR